MAGETRPTHDHADGVEMPLPTAWPMVVAVAVALLVTGIVTNLALTLVGGVLLAVSIAGWIVNLLPGEGHGIEPLAPPEQRARPIQARPGTVEQMRPGLPGHRFQLPEKIHPISAGIKGGLIGGLIMPIPALLYGLFSSHHSLWFPVNLLAGMLLPGVGDLNEEGLRQFYWGATGVAICIHATLSLGLGLVYGVLLPTLPEKLGGSVLWGGIVLPLLWTGASYGLMGAINPTLETHVNWFWFIVSQLVFGVTAALVVQRSEKIAIAPIPASQSPAFPSAAHSGRGAPGVHYREGEGQHG